MARVFFLLMLVPGGMLAAMAQQPGATPAEYAAYISALNTVDPADRRAALEGFLQQYPTSALRDQAAYNLALNAVDFKAALAALGDFIRQYPDSSMGEQAQERYMSLLVYLDNQQTAFVRQKLREAAKKTGPPAWERACRLANEKAPEYLSLAELEFILQFRDVGSDCNRDSAENAWRRFQQRQHNADGTPFRIKMPEVLVIAADDKYFYAALPDRYQEAHEPDLRIHLKDPAAKRPAPGEKIAVSGFIVNYSVDPFLFHMTGAEILPPAQAAGPVAEKPLQQIPVYPQQKPVYPNLGVGTPVPK